MKTLISIIAFFLIMQSVSAQLQIVILCQKDMLWTLYDINGCQISSGICCCAHHDEVYSKGLLVIKTPEGEDNSYVPQCLVSAIEQGFYNPVPTGRSIDPAIMAKWPITYEIYIVQRE